MEPTRHILLSGMFAVAWIAAAPAARAQTIAAGITAPEGGAEGMTIDETLDIGLDTRTGVDNSYELPFKFTGTIDKLTFKLGKDQMVDADKKATD